MNREPGRRHDSVKLPPVSREAIARTLREQWGLEGDLSPLNGERDLNYRFRQSDTGNGFVFKVCNAAEEPTMLDCQAEVFRRLASIDQYRFTRLIHTRDGTGSASIIGDDGASYRCRLTDWVEGRLYADCFPRYPSLHRSLGRCLARVDEALDGLEQQALHRPLPWDLCRAMEVLSRYTASHFTPHQRRLVNGFQALYRERVEPVADQLRRGVIHNDANDNNILVGPDSDGRQRVVGLIDFGDMMHGWLASEVAIGCTYAMMDSVHPLDVAADIIAGYHEVTPLREVELGVILPLVGIRLCLSVSIAAAHQRQEPDNEYLGISVASSWKLMEKLAAVPPDFATYLFRARCGFSPVPAMDRIEQWLRTQTGFSGIVDTPLEAENCLVLDASVTSPHIEFGWRPHDAEVITREIFQAMENAKATVGIGRYGEYRLIYDSDDFMDFSGHRRTLHLGIDIFQPTGSSVFAPLPGRVHSTCNNPAQFDYGGSVVLVHETEDGDSFYTLYGHLDPESLSHLHPGGGIAAGDRVGRMGAPVVNGDWPPHVHFEIILDLLGSEGTFVGVGSHAHRDVWCAICPDPNLILRMGDGLRGVDLAPRRVEDPANIPVRGAAQYVYDETGRRYLDARGGGSYLGHCHPGINRAAIDQACLSTEPVPASHPMAQALAIRLRELAPPNIEKIYLAGGLQDAFRLALAFQGLTSSESPGSIPNAGILLDAALHSLGRTDGANGDASEGGTPPELIVLGESLANGFPLGAILVANSLPQPDTGMNHPVMLSPVALAAANQTLDRVAKSGFHQRVETLSQVLALRLQKLHGGHPKHFTFQVEGLRAEIEFHGQHAAGYMASRLAEEGILVQSAPEESRVVFAPPMTVSEGDLGRFADTLESILTRDNYYNSNSSE